MSGSNQWGITAMQGSRKPGDFIRFAGPVRNGGFLLDLLGTVATHGMVRVGFEQAMVSIQYGWKFREVRDVTLADESTALFCIMFKD